MATGSNSCGPWPVAEDRKLGHRCLYLCTADRPDLEAFLAAVIEGGVDIVQLRDKHLEARDILTRATVARHVCHDYGVPFILNDRPDLAIEAEADGVHVGQDDAPPALARRLLGISAIVGYSTHAPNELDAALGEPVDYFSVGPVTATPTKEGRRPTGPEYVRYAALNATRPFFVTGGVTPDTVPGLVDAGARRFVVVRYLTEAADPKTNARALREAITRATVAAQ
jgi:thiamine-phosphate pyrophosphorylase